jgi:transposase InsO family protein
VDGPGARQRRTQQLCADPIWSGATSAPMAPNAMAESFVDTFKTELIADRVWRSRSQLELAVVEYVAWFNNERLHESLGDISPAEFEDLYVDSGGRHISPYMKIGSN